MWFVTCSCFCVSPLACVRFHVRVRCLARNRLRCCLSVVLRCSLSIVLARALTSLCLSAAVGAQAKTMTTDDLVFSSATKSLALADSALSDFRPSRGGGAGSGGSISPTKLPRRASLSQQQQPAGAGTGTAASGAGAKAKGETSPTKQPAKKPIKKSLSFMGGAH